LLPPVRGVLIAAVGCALLLGLSQFADYRGVAIGVDELDSGIAPVAAAPELEREEIGSAHAYAMVPAALLAIAILLAAARSGRWQLCRLSALIGIVVIAVSFLVDRPTGLDEGNLARHFAGVEAQLLGGFWAQVFAGVGLIATSLLLGAEIRREAPSATRRGDSRQGKRRRRRPAGGGVSYQR
jgi:hypothetical protein